MVVDHLVCEFLNKQLAQWGLEVTLQGKVQMKHVIQDILTGKINWIELEPRVFECDFHGISWTTNSSVIKDAEVRIRRQALKEAGITAIIIKKD